MGAAQEEGRLPWSVLAADAAAAEELAAAMVRLQMGGPGSPSLVQQLLRMPIFSSPGRPVASEAAERRKGDNREEREPRDSPRSLLLHVLFWSDCR